MTRRRDLQWKLGEKRDVGAAAYSVQATELIAGHGDDDGDELPANSWGPQHL